MAIADLLRNFGGKVGDTFASMGSTPLGNLTPEQQRRKNQMQGLRNLGEQFQILGAMQSNRPQQAAFIQNQIKQREIDALNAEQKRKFNEFLSTPDGSKYKGMVDLLGVDLTRQAVAKNIFAKPDKPPTNIAEYEYAKNSGQFKGTFPEFLESKKASTNINMNNSGFQNLAEKNYQASYEAAEDAVQINNNLDILDNLLDAGVTTGFGASAGLFTKRLGQFFVGEDYKVPEIAGQEQFQAETTKLILPLVKQLGVNPTDKDLEFVKTGSVELSKSPAGNKLLLASLRKANARRIDEKRFNDSFYMNNPEASIFERNIAFDEHRNNPANQALYSSQEIIDAYNNLMTQSQSEEVINSDTNAPF